MSTTLTFKKLEALTNKLAEPSKILIVEDEPSCMDVLVGIIRSEGYIPVCSFSVPVALECIAQQKIDLVFLDLILPGQDGVDFLNEIRKRTPRPPIVIVSGAADATLMNSLMQVYPVVFCVGKPYTPDTIVEILDSFKLNRRKP